MSLSGRSADLSARFVVGELPCRGENRSILRPNPKWMEFHCAIACEVCNRFVLPGLGESCSLLISLCLTNMRSS
jgi:hypothetical protein